MVKHKKCVLVDGAGLVYRSFFAIPQTLTDSEGKPTNAVLGFTNILLSILQIHKPDYLIVAFDKKGPTFRHKEYKEYKATRAAAPQELYDQFPMVKEVTKAMGVPIFEVDDYEADDVIATLTEEFKKQKGNEVLIATGDFDMFQLADGEVKILYPEKGFREAKIFGPKEIEEKYGIKPSQVADYKGLRGDASDNIKGVMGIGEKTAKSLLALYGSIEKIYEHLDEIPETVRKKLEAGRKDALFSKKLTTLVSKVPLEFSETESRVKPLNPDRVIPVFEKYGFRNLMKRLGLISSSAKNRNKAPENQTALF